MAKLVLLLVFVCFQFSGSEELPEIEEVKLDITEDEIPFNDQTGPEFEVLDGADENQWSPVPWPDDEDEIPFNNQTAPDTEMLDGADENQWSPPQLDDEDEIPFNNQTAPDTEVLDSADEDDWYSGSKFDEDWATQKLSEYLQMMLNGTNSDKEVEELEKLIEELKEWAALYPDYNSDDWEGLDSLSDEYDYDWDILGDLDYFSEETDVVVKKNGNVYNTMASMKFKGHPAKRFTSV